MADNFWLNDAQWALIEAHLPKVHTGPERKDDRRVISDIPIACARAAAGARSGRIRAVHHGVQPLLSNSMICRRSC